MPSLTATALMIMVTDCHAFTALSRKRVFEDSAADLAYQKIEYSGHVKARKPILSEI